MRLIVGLVMFILFFEGIYTLFTSELCSYISCFKVDRLVSILIGGLSFFGVYALWYIGDFTEYWRDRNNKSKKIPIPSLNIDLISEQNTEWIDDIKLRYKRKEKIIAYSKKGSNRAREKAKNLGIEKCFIDFKSQEEMKEERGW